MGCGISTPDTSLKKKWEEWKHTQFPTPIIRNFTLDEILTLILQGEIKDIRQILDILIQCKNPNENDKLKKILTEKLGLFRQLVIDASDCEWVREVFGVIKKEGGVPPFEMKLIDLFLFTKNGCDQSSIDESAFSFESEAELNTFLPFFKKPEDKLILICEYLDFYDVNYLAPWGFLWEIEAFIEEKTKLSGDEIFSPLTGFLSSNSAKIINRITNLGDSVKLDLFCKNITNDSRISPILKRIMSNHLYRLCEKLNQTRDFPPVLYLLELLLQAEIYKNDKSYNKALCTINFNRRNCEFKSEILYLFGYSHKRNVDSSFFEQLDFFIDQHFHLFVDFVKQFDLSYIHPAKMRMMCRSLNFAILCLEKEIDIISLAEEALPLLKEDPDCESLPRKLLRCVVLENSRLIRRKFLIRKR